MAYLHDHVTINPILQHLGLSPPEEHTPALVQEVVRVPVDEEGREEAPYRPADFA